MVGGKRYSAHVIAFKMQAERFKGCFVRQNLFLDLHGRQGFVVLRKLVQESKVDELVQAVDIPNTNWFAIDNRGLTPPHQGPPNLLLIHPSI